MELLSCGMPALSSYLSPPRSPARPCVPLHPPTASNILFIQLGTASIYAVPPSPLSALLFLTTFQGTLYRLPPRLQRGVRPPLHPYPPPTPAPSLNPNSPPSPTPRRTHTILTLAGLWGGLQKSWTWVERIAPTKEALRSKYPVLIFPVCSDKLPTAAPSPTLSSPSTSPPPSHRADGGSSPTGAYTTGGISPLHGGPPPRR
jgi:hypothetical protein